MYLLARASCEAFHFQAVASLLKLKKLEIIAVMSEHLSRSVGGPWIILVLVLILNGCTANEPFRFNEPRDCDLASCESAIIEHHDQYDLAFVEFTERGNVFERQHLKTALNHVADEASYDAANADKGVLAIVFVHGWKHNASHNDDNVKSFKKLLAKTAELTKNDQRRLVGIYVGWRGLSLNADPITELSYWDRKAVAHQVGKGGVTEFLLRLEHEVVDDSRPNRNLLLVTGHSFGGGIVLAALNEILLERVLDAVPNIDEDGCLKGRSFGHGVALLNPAVEANEMLQLKELVANGCFAQSQDRLMHVISSDADTATNFYFPLGQWFGVNLGWRQADIDRVFSDHMGNERTVRFKESELDTITVGNYAPFRTGRLKQVEDKPGTWRYSTCVLSDKCLDDDEDIDHLPIQLRQVPQLGVECADFV